MDKGIKILILDDSPTDAELVKRHLQQPFPMSEFLTVDNEQAYTTALEKFKPDVIISDYSLNQFSGFKAFSLLQERKLPIPFILVTGTLPEEAATTVKTMGVDYFLLKDDLQTLPSIVKTVLEKTVNE